MSTRAEAADSPGQAKLPLSIHVGQAWKQAGLGQFKASAGRYKRKDQIQAWRGWASLHLPVYIRTRMEVLTKLG